MPDNSRNAGTSAVTWHPDRLMIASLLGASIGVPYLAFAIVESNRSPAPNRLRQRRRSPALVARAPQPAAASAEPAESPASEPGSPLTPAACRSQGPQIHAARTSAAIRRDEGLGLSQLGSQVDRPDRRRPVRRARAAGDRHAQCGAGRLVDVLLQLRTDRWNTFRFAAARATRRSW